jgi:hypothetical protein
MRSLRTSLFANCLECRRVCRPLAHGAELAVGKADYRVWNKTDALFYPQLVTTRLQLAPAGSGALG